jgi:hypothetical protein
MNVFLSFSVYELMSLYVPQKCFAVILKILISQL